MTSVNYKCSVERLKELFERLSGMEIPRAGLRDIPPTVKCGVEVV